MAITELLAAINEEIARLQQVRKLLVGQETGSRRTKTWVGGETDNDKAARKRVLSPEARKRIADAQKKRWAAPKRGKAQK
jgi:hypothetical protein